MQIEFIRGQVEPEIVPKDGCPWNLYGPMQSVRAYKVGYGEVVLYGDYYPFHEDFDAYRVSLIGA